MTAEPQESGPIDADGVLELGVVVPNKAGLHARSAAALIREAARFQSTVTLHAAGESARTRSLTELLRLSARQGDTIRIRAAGDDARAALSAIQALIERGFGEE